MSSGSHYDTLGVSPDASADEIRSAYLALARRHHPDRHHGPARVEAERRMQLINAAWNVVGDVDRRRDYDLARGGPGAAHRTTRGFTASTTHERVEFTPFDDTEYGRSTDERPYRSAKRIPRWATMTPFALFVVAAVTLFGGVLLNSRGVMGLGVAVLGLAIVGFFVVPLLALSAAERDRR